MNKSDDDDNDDNNDNSNNSNNNNNNNNSHCQTTESHVTVYPTCRFFASSNITVKNRSTFAHSVAGQIQFQFSPLISNIETQFPFINNYKLWHCLSQKLNL